MNFKVNTDLSKLDSTEGIVYVLEMEVDGNIVVKVGFTKRVLVTDRICEILTSFFNSYRYFTRLYPKRYRRTSEAFEKEQEILTYFKNRKYESKKKFSGCQELLDVPLDEVVEVYERVLKGEKLDKELDNSKRCGRGAREKREDTPPKKRGRPAGKRDSTPRRRKSTKVGV